MLQAIRSFTRLHLYNLKTGRLQLYANYANSTGLSFDAERVFATMRGTNAVTWDLSRTGEFTLEFEVFDFSYIAMLAGQDGMEKGAHEAHRRETLKVPATGIVILEDIPLPGSVTVQPTTDDGVTFIGAPLEEGVAADFEVSGNEITFETSVAEGVTVAVTYWSPADGSERITINADKFAPSFKLIADAEARRKANGSDQWLQVILPNIRPKSAFELSFGNDVTTVSTTFDIMMDTNGDMGYLTLIPDVEKGMPEDIR